MVSQPLVLCWKVLGFHPAWALLSPKLAAWRAGRSLFISQVASLAGARGVATGLVAICPDTGKVGQKTGTKIL